MSQSNPILQTSPSKPAIDEDLLDYLHGLPSNFDLALNGGTTRYLSPNPSKSVPGQRLDSDIRSLRRLSISTIPSINRSRGPSPYPTGHSALGERRIWRTRLQTFWNRNEGPVLVAVSQLFAALMNVTTRVLELEGEGMNPFQLLFARMALTTVLCCIWMCWAKVPDFPLGARGIRWLLVARGITGFFGIFGVYCKHLLHLYTLEQRRKLQAFTILRHTDRFASISPTCRCIRHYLSFSFSSCICLLYLPS